MGAGKSSAARAVAAELGVPAVDSDHEIERELGGPIESWFDRNGEAAFRKVEEDVVLRLLERPDLRVLALGGGSLGSERVQEALRRHVVVYLDVDTESAWHRCGGNRPLARDRNRFEQLHDERRPLYEHLADAWLPAAERSTVRTALPALGALARGPTTLVAQVDSAFGGKTGVDLPEGKNYMGVYHQPSAVIVDPDALATLPAAEAAAGYAEVVKTALIAGGRLWARVRRGGEVDDDTIIGCIQTKLNVVAEDERDSGRRQVLNLGHTIAHAIESATGYSRYRHGEAVALGLLAALRLSDRPQLRDEVERLFQAHGLATHLDGLAPADIVPFLSRD